jgi:drug/metabolite transporter (DMT)-like permease
MGSYLATAPTALPIPPLALFVSCVAIWGTTWFAIIYQLGVVPPEQSVGYRFLLAGVAMLTYCRFRGLTLTFTRTEHLRFGLQGLAMFCASYILVYHAERHIVSGLVAVGYSAMPLLNMLGLRAVFGTPFSRQVALGGGLGVLGIVLIYGSEFMKLTGDPGTVLGLTLAVLSVLASCWGSMVATSNQKRALPIWQTMAFGMMYGGLAALLFALATGQNLVWDSRPMYLATLIYLAIFGSILAFGGYLVLLGQWGAARASYIGVMVPVVALMISAAFENFVWQPTTFLGVLVSIIGNVIILRRPT